MIHAPFTPEQVAALKTWQASDLVHPFTCARRHEEGHKEYAEKEGHLDHGILDVNEQGFYCPVCDYKQNWCHDVMVRVIPRPPFPVPRICGTCSKREPESGYCIMWCRITDSSATCEHWAEEDDAYKGT